MKLFSVPGPPDTATGRKGTSWRLGALVKSVQVFSCPERRLVGQTPRG